MKDRIEDAISRVLQDYRKVSEKKQDEDEDSFEVDKTIIESLLEEKEEIDDSVPPGLDS